LVEQLICNQQVVGSNPSAGSIPLEFGGVARDPAYETAIQDALDADL
jgi:hypothetical protein